MAIEWLAGNRLRGTTAERPNFGLPSGSVGGWVEVGRTTLGSNGQTITVSSIPDKRYYMILHNYKLTGAGTGGNFRVGNGTIDSGSNYSRRKSQNGTESTQTSTTTLMDIGGYSDTKEFGVSYIANLSTKEKLHLGHYTYGIVGAANAYSRREWASKWTNTSNVIDIVEAVQGGSDNFTSGDEIVVLGWDPADTHTSNFWEELDSVDLSGGAASSLTSNNFTSKKYLWIQYYIDTTTSAANIEMQVGNTTIDTGSNYARRASENGGADGTATSDSKINQIVAGGSTPIFANMFIINNASNEKLSICHSIDQNTAGAGTAPNREEDVGKWANTSNQIDIVKLNASAGNMGTNTIMKIWGAD